MRGRVDHAGCRAIRDVAEDIRVASRMRTARSGDAPA